LIGVKAAAIDHEIQITSMPKIPINDPKHWQERAEEARAMAEQLTDEKCARKRSSRARPIMSAPSGEIGSGGRVNHAWMSGCVRASV
jgi:hypothetical protein